MRAAGSEIAVSPGPWQLVIGVAACAAATLGASLLLAQQPLPRPAPATLALDMTADEPHELDAATVHEPLNRHLDPSQMLPVVRIGRQTYMKLAAIDDGAMPVHGSPTLRIATDSVHTVTAEIAASNVGIEHRGWLHRDVYVDGTCHATVEGFAVVARLVGSPLYAGFEEDWTAKSVLEFGAPFVAAKLSGCTGDYARDASLSRAITLVDDKDAGLAKAAWNQLAAFDRRVNGHDVVRTVRVLRHPTTGTTWVLAHGLLDEGCGGDSVNAFGLFVVNHGGNLSTVVERDLGDLWSIDRIIDITNVGPVLSGKDQLGMDKLLTLAWGEELARLPLEFYGCGC
jgi:hypothetical protein